MGARATEFVSRANAVCAKYEKRVQSKMSGVPAGDEQQLASSIEKVIPVIRKGNDELRSLKPPGSLPLRPLAADRRRGGSAAQKLRDALRQSDQTAIRAAFKVLQTKDADQDQLARQELGLTGCASGSTG